MEKTVVELFAGVGGFRLGLEKAGWKTVYADQWEPNAKIQHAFNTYASHFSSGIITNKDIAQVQVDEIPSHTLLCGGFPCQDYSVAATLAQSKGIEGKKGVLWWEIRRIIEAKRPPFVLLENVDRLLKSPASQRGRDFGIILSCLNSMGYTVEWRVINAAEYGFSQRRRRTFIFATNKKIYDSVAPDEIILSKGLFARGFKCQEEHKDKTRRVINIPNDLVELSNNFSGQFENSGFSENFVCTTIRTCFCFEGVQKTLGSVLESGVDEHYYIKDEEEPKWKYLKGAKKERRKTKDGFEYSYSEGPIAYPDYLDKPSRTMLTSEASRNRSTHVVLDPETKKLRLLTPVECERLDGFPDNWTEGMPEKMRYFCMGNALVVGLIEIMGNTLNEFIDAQ